MRGAEGGGACPKLFETQACEVNPADDAEGCTQAVLEILDGTWSPDDASNADYTVCTGGEVDNAAKLAPFKDCQLISGNLKFFIPIDFDVGSTFASLIAVSGDVVFYNTGLKQLLRTAISSGQNQLCLIM